MPRPKTIANERIALNKIVQQKHLDIVEQKDCFLVELVFKAPFTNEQWNIIKDRFRFAIVDKTACVVSRKINNSWKGLVMALLSMAYCKHRENITDKFYATKAMVHTGSSMVIGFYYERLLDREIWKQLEAKANQQMEEVDMNRFLDFFKESEEVHRERAKQHTRKVFSELIKKLPIDDRIEEVAGPKDWRTLYVRAEYEAIDIQDHLVLLGKMLDLDMKKSCIDTFYSENLPHTYSAKAAEPKYCGWYE